MVLTACSITSFVLFLSSRPVTGRSPFTDFRLFAVFAVSAALWVVWERRRNVPFVTISLFAKAQFARATSCVSVRMALLGAVNFLVPLYAADVLGVPPSQTGLMITLHSAALLATMRFGGRLADTWNRRYAVLIGLSGQTSMLLWLALAGSATIVGLIAPLVLHGAFAGLHLASLHHVALHEVPAESAGVGAGTYSMSRFLGSLIGASVMGISLEHALGTAADVHAAYQMSFLIAAALGAVGLIPAFGIRSRRER
jgi:DHA2 family multidrug resistance protein-like MFS transporter